MRLVTTSQIEGSSCGAEIAPRGVSLAVKGPPWIPRSNRFDRETSLSRYDFELLASAGVNVIRLGAMMPGVMPDAPLANGTYSQDDEYIDHLKSIVQEASDYGIYTLIEFHQDVLSEFYCGEGIPIWAGEEIQAAFHDEFEEEMLELLHRLMPELPGLDGFEDDYFRQLIQNHFDQGQARFPSPCSAPYKEVDEKERIGQQIYNHSDCIQREWYEYQMSFATGHAYRRLFNLETNTYQHFLRYWEILAKAFKGNPNVLAFDLFNEPFPGNFLTEPWIILPENAAERLEPFYKRTTHAIHDIDPTRLVTFSPVTWEEGGYYMQQVANVSSLMCGWLRRMLLNVPLPGCEMFWDIARWMPAKGLETSGFNAAPLPGQSILSFHFYTPPNLNHENYARKRKEDAKALGVYPLLSETCCLSDVDALQRLYWFEKQQMGWIMWEYKNQADRMGYGAYITGTGPAMFHEDGTPIRTQWRRLSHPSGQFVYGDVQANIFDFTKGTFNLTFIPDQDCPESGPDATIVWPWAWWAYINITSQPTIAVIPEGAAEVEEAPQGGIAPVVKFEVRVLRRVRAPITVTLSFMNFVNIDLVPEQPEPTFAVGPWWAGLGWPLVAVLFVLLPAAVVGWCCYRCCCRCACLRSMFASGTPKSPRVELNRLMQVEASPRVPSTADTSALSERSRPKTSREVAPDASNDEVRHLMGRTSSEEGSAPDSVENIKDAASLGRIGAAETAAGTSSGRHRSLSTSSEGQPLLAGYVAEDDAEDAEAAEPWPAPPLEHAAGVGEPRGTSGEDAVYGPLPTSARSPPASDRAASAPVPALPSAPPSARSAPAMQMSGRDGQPVDFLSDDLLDAGPSAVHGDGGL